MSFNAGAVVATLRMEGVDKFGRDSDKAKGALDGIRSAGHRVGESLKGAFHQAATTATAAAGGATALAVSVFKTGAAYNTLQQASRAALTTLLGGAKQANAQMDKLDTFAKSSPFAKGMFISAQQQMISFGVETKKVIPYLNALQNAVAATGGNSNQVGELAFIMSQIQSSAKITAEDFNQFGQRGVNAADLIASQMGKTSAEIRKMVTKGTLPAQEALDALAAGMEKKFSGAAAGVKNTVEGAKDRVKAAIREIGATMAEPFIAQKGGGLAIQWGNQVADVLQAVRGHMQPLVGIVTNRLTPAFATITRLLDSAKVSIKAWDSSRFEKFLDKMANHKAALAGVAGGFAAFSSGLLASIPVLGSFIPAVSPLAGILGGIALASPEVRESLAGLFASLEPLIPAVSELARMLSESLTQALPVASALIQGFTGAIAPLVHLVSSIPAPLIAAGAAAVATALTFKKMSAAFSAATAGLRDQMALQRALGGMARQSESTATALGAVANAAGNTGKQVGRWGGIFGVAGRAASGVGLALKAAFISNPIGLAITGITLAVGALAAAFGASAQRIAEQRDAVLAMRDAYKLTGEAQKEAIDTNIEQRLSHREAAKFARQLGVDMETVTKAAHGNKDAIDAVNKAAERFNNGGSAAGDAPIKMAFDGTLTSGEDLKNVIKDINAASHDGAEAARRDAEAERERQRAMSDAERSANRMADALKLVSDNTRDASERMSAYLQFLDELNGGQMSAEKATRKLNDEMRTIESQLGQTNEQGKKLWKTFLDAKGGIDSTTQAGSDFSATMEDMVKAHGAAIFQATQDPILKGDYAGAMKAATEKSDEFLSKLRDRLKAQGLEKSQIDGIIAKFKDPINIVMAIDESGKADLTNAEAQVVAIATKLRQSPKMKLEVDSKDLPDLEQVLNRVGASVTDFPGLKVKTDKGSITVAKAVMDGLVVPRDAKIKPSVDPASSKTAYDVLADLAKTVYKSVIVDVKTTGAGGNKSVGRLLGYENANGGMYFGGVKAFANGGFEPGIYAGRPGAIHKFAEPETRWEAYVSGKPGMEERNRTIVKEAAKRLGGVAAFANGGFAQFANGGFTVTQSLRERFNDWMWDWNTAQRRGENTRAGVEGNGLSLVDKLLQISRDVGGRVGKQLEQTAIKAERAYVNLDRAREASDAKLEATQKRNAKRLEAANEGLGKANDKLRDATSAFDSIVSQAKSMASSVANAVRGLFKLGDLGKATVTETTRTERTTQNVGGFELTTTQQVTDKVETPATAGSIAESMAGTAARIRRFADKLKQLAGRGLAPGMLAELASLGVENGEPIADALLGATAGEISSINDSYKAIGEGSELAGSTVSDANFADLIRETQKQVDLAQQAVDKAQATVNAIESETAKAIAAAERQQAELRKQLAAETRRIISNITGALNAGVRAPVVGRAGGGRIYGPGTSTSDSVPIQASPGEHMWSALEVQRAGGHAQMERLRALSIRGGLDLSKAATPGRAVPVPVAATEGDLHVHFEAIAQPGEPLSVQGARAASRLQLMRKTGRLK